MRLPIALFIMALLAGCGGDSGGSGQSANTALTITSAGTASVAENTSGTVYQATATAPAGRTVTFRLEGSDASRFAITGAGAVSFAATPDFEAPTDGDRNNVYDIVVVGSDGVLEGRANVSITVTNTPDDPVARAITGFSEPRYIAAIPGSGDIFVGDVKGLIYRTNPAQAGPGQLYLTLANLQPRRTLLQVDERPFISLVAAPDFATSGTIYAMVVSDAGNLEVRRYGRTAGGLGDPASADVILRIANVDANSTSLGGGLVFGPDGFLYIGIGNGQAYGSAPGTRAQDLTDLRGKILRVDIRTDAFPADPNRDYAIPATNPFQTGGRAPEIYAYGLENPRRMSFDGSNLLIGESHASAATIVDQQLQEVDLVRPQDAGANFGFPATEGTGVLAPVIYTNGTLNHLGAMTGGFVYRGPVTPFVGLYFLADIVTGKVWSVPASSIVQGATLNENQLTRRDALLTSQQASSSLFSFGTDSNNNLYFVNGSSSIYIIELR